MTTYGRVVNQTTGQPLMAMAGAAHEMDWKTGGVSIDWNAVPSYSAPKTLGDGWIVPAGNAAIEYGTILGLITATNKYAPWTAAAPGATTVAGATAIGATTFAVASAANLFVGDVMTLDAGGNLETIRIAAINGTTITPVAPLAIAHANGVQASKTDEGRATLLNGKTWIVNRTVIRDSLTGLGGSATDHPAVFDGGRVFTARLKVGGTNQPTLANLMAALPRLIPVVITQ